MSSAPEAVGQGDGADDAPSLHPAVHHRLPGGRLLEGPPRGARLIVVIILQGGRR